MKPTMKQVRDGTQNKLRQHMTYQRVTRQHSETRKGEIMNKTIKRCLQEQKESKK